MTAPGPLLGLSSELLEIIVCPDDHGDLTPVEIPSKAGQGGGLSGELVCQRCGLAYPVRDGIPVLLVDEARRPDQSRPDQSRPVQA